MAALFRIHEDLHIQTDHRNLIYMFQKRDMNNKLLRWSLALQDFSFTIDHIPGRQNVVADQLSRVACNSTTVASNWPEQILEAQQTAPAEERSTWEQRGFDRQPDGLWTKEGIPVVPHGAAELQAQIVAYSHQRHQGEGACLKRAMEVGWWTGRAHQVSEKVRKCPFCLKTRLRRFLESQSGSTTAHVNEPWHTVAIDTVGPLPMDESGNKFIFVLVDLYTRYTELVPAPANNAQEAARAIWLTAVRHGIPPLIKSDNGSEYINSVVKELISILDTHQQRTLPYHPQSNGVVERKNGEVMRHLRWLALAMDKSPRWSDLLPFTQHILNTTTHAETGFSPQEMLYGRRAEIGRVNLSRIETADKCEARTLTDTQEYVARLRELQANIDALNQPTEVPCEGQPLEPGELVLLLPVKKTKLQGLAGPYKVLRTRLNKAVEIASLVEDAVKVVHESKLMRFDADVSEDEARRLQATDYMEYVVSKVLGHDIKAKTLHIMWDGYDETTWEPLYNVKRVRLVQDYLKRHKLRWSGRAPPSEEG